MGKNKLVLFKTADELIEGYGLRPKSVEESNSGTRARFVFLRGKKLASGNVSLYLNRQEKGKQVKRYLDKSILSIETDANIKARNKEMIKRAREIADEADLLVLKEINGFTIAKKTDVNLVSYIISKADEALKESGNKHGYYYTLHALAKHITLYSGKNTKIQEVDKNYILGFIAYLKTAKNFNYKRTGTNRDKDVCLGQNTQHNLFMKFKYVLKNAVQAEVIDVNPIDKLNSSDKPKENEASREYLTIEDIKKMIETPCKNDMIKRAFLFCCLVGLTYSDVTNVTWGELQSRTNGETLLCFKKKSRKRRESLPVSKEALKWLPERWECSDSDLIFRLPKNDSANRQLKRWVDMAGIKKEITFHCARHTTATLNLSLGMSVETVAKLMGYTKIASMKVYAKLIADSKREAVNKQNGVFD